MGRWDARGALFPDLRQRAVRQRHRVAARHQSAAALPARASCATQPSLRFTRRVASGGGGRPDISSSPSSRIFLHIHPREGVCATEDRADDAGAVLSWSRRAPLQRATLAGTVPSSPLPAPTEDIWRWILVIQASV